ncbi:MAG: NAD(P)H-hydrate dehydratase [Thermoplasmata archaeon]|nr:NAD(P)H-hydrate dehydratase [Thermoplasmata archaeon]
MAERPLSPLEIRVLEANALALGATVPELMENAGRAVAEEASRRLPAAPARVAIVGGVGRNGGDGFAAAHYLGQWGYRPELWLVGTPSEIRSASARRCYDRAARHHPTRTQVPTATELAESPLVLDALVGIGLRGPLRGRLQEAAAAMNDCGRPILSVDSASGWGHPGAVRPRFTVTFTAPKEGMDAANSGEVIVREVGIPERALSETGPGEFHRYPVPTGARTIRLLVIGGGPFAGAPALTALAALRAGAERVTVLAPALVAGQVQGFSPNLVVRGVGESRFTPAELEPMLGIVEELHPSAIVVGMGAGRAPETLELCRQLVGGLDPAIPLLVDADALGALDWEHRAPRTGETLATPNDGELRHLYPELTAATDGRRGFLEGRARTLHLSILAKGDPDLIATPTGFAINRHHAAAASVSGVGDLLSGVAGFLLGAGLPSLGAARLASFWVGEAGLLAFASHSHGLVATDVLRRLPKALASGLRALEAGAAA